MPTVKQQPSLEQSFADLRGPKIGFPLLQMVMDYAPGDMAVSEVTQKLACFLPNDWHMNFTSVPSFKTTATGFVVGQLALSPRDPLDPPLVLYVNCAPRKDTRESRKDNEGEGLVYGKLDNGVEIVSVNSKFSLSVLRKRFESLYMVRVSAAGSQFRSRDNFPPFVGAVAQKKDLSEWLGEKLNPLKAFPEFKAGYIGYIDSFGNIKTTYRDSTKALKGLKPGQQIEIDINGTEIVAQVATESFNVAVGHFAFAPGSSGWDDRFWEIFQREFNAANSFKNPQVGSKVELTPIK